MTNPLTAVRELLTDLIHGPVKRDNIEDYEQQTNHMIGVAQQIRDSVATLEQQWSRSEEAYAHYKALEALQQDNGRDSFKQGFYAGVDKSGGASFDEHWKDIEQSCWNEHVKGWDFVQDDTAAPGEPAPIKHGTETNFGSIGVVQVCPECDIAGCKHIRAQPTPEPLACREAFEARGRKLKWNLFTFPNGEYETLWMQKAWEAWQACHARLAAELDKPELVEAVAEAMLPGLPSRSWYDKKDPTGAKWAKDIATEAAQAALRAIKGAVL